MDDEQSVAELLAAAEVALTNYLVAKSQGLQPGGCCSNDSWRGRLCSYHSGYRDGIETVLEQWRLVPALVHREAPA